MASLTKTQIDRMQIAGGLALAELAAVRRKHPKFNSTHEGYAVLKEEVDEMWDEIKANNTENSLDEAIQVAAMALSYIADISTDEQLADLAERNAVKLINAPAFE